MHSHRKSECSRHNDEAIGPRALSAAGALSEVEWAEGLPVSVGNCICIPVAVLAERAEAQDAGGIVRVGAAGAVSGAEWVEGGEEFLRVGMPSPSDQSSVRL